MPKITIELEYGDAVDLLAHVHKEAAVRKRSYPKWLREGRTTREAATADWLRWSKLTVLMEQLRAAWPSGAELLRQQLEEGATAPDTTATAIPLRPQDPIPRY
jgi:hypothetical protein